MIELRLAPISLDKRAKQTERRVSADGMALCDIGHDAKPFGREVLHNVPPAPVPMAA